MTDRLKGCTVLFDQDIRVDDAEALLNAIRMIKGVQSVIPSINTSDDWMAAARARQDARVGDITCHGVINPIPSDAGLFL